MRVSESESQKLSYGTSLINNNRAQMFSKPNRQIFYNQFLIIKKGIIIKEREERRKKKL